MISRKFAAVAIAAGLLFSTTACSFNPHPDSLQSYAPSDGSGADINLGSGQGLKLRNFVYLTDGTAGALIGVIVNSGSDSQTVTINYSPADTAAQAETITVAGNSSYSIGFNGNPASAIMFSGKAGDIATLSIGAKDNSEWATLNVPLLDGTFDYYQSITNDIAAFSSSPVVCADASVVAVIGSGDACSSIGSETVNN